MLDASTRTGTASGCTGASIVRDQCGDACRSKSVSGSAPHLLHVSAHVHDIERFIRRRARLLQRVKRRMKSATTLVDNPPKVGNSHPPLRRGGVENTRGPLLSVEEAATYLGVRPGTLRNWLSARRLAYVKVGRLTRLSSDTLNRFITEHTVDSVDDLEP